MDCQVFYGPQCSWVYFTYYLYYCKAIAFVICILYDYLLIYLHMCNTVTVRWLTIRDENETRKAVVAWMCRCYVVFTNENEAFLGTHIRRELNHRINNVSVLYLCVRFTCVWGACVILFVFGCQYQCTRLLGMIRVRNDLFYVQWDYLRQTWNCKTLYNPGVRHAVVKIVPVIFCTTNENICEQN